MKTLSLAAASLSLTACVGTETDDYSPVSSVTSDPSPTVIAALSDADMTALEVGEGVELHIKERVLSGAKGSTITKLGKLDGQDIYLMSLLFDSLPLHLTEIIASPDLDAYFDRFSIFDNYDAEVSTTIIDEAPISDTMHKYALIKDHYDGDREDLSMSLYGDGGSLSGGYVSYFENNIEVARRYGVITTSNTFTFPTGGAELVGIGVLGRTGDTANGSTDIFVSGDAFMSVDFDTLSGTIRSPSLTDNNGILGSMDSEFALNATTGKFAGMTTAILDGENGSGTLIGTFNSDGSLDMGVSSLNGGDMTGFFALAE